MSEPILWEKRGPIRILTLNRPEVLNAFNLEMMRFHRARLEEFRDDPDAWVLVYTGAGRAFSAGLDLKEGQPFIDASAEERLRLWVTPNSLGVMKPTLCAINGVAVGGGLEVALGCDLRIASENARLGLPEVRWALFPAGGGTQWLPRLVGLSRASYLLLTGEMVDARTALEMGLVHRVVPPDRLMDEALALAERLCQNGPVAMRLAKQAMLEGFQTSLPQGLWLEQVLFHRNRAEGREDIEEGLRAFQEKRQPRYRGR